MASPQSHLFSRLAQQPKHVQFHHVTIDGTGTTSYSTPALYERAVLALLHRIHRSHTGRATFHEFAVRSHKGLQVVPLENVLNAFAGPLDARQATQKGMPERSGADGSVLLDAGGKSIIGLGGGSDSKVSFTPRTFTRFCNHQKRAHKCGAQPDEVLFHEMIHATRQMRGLFNPLPLGFLYDTEEEFYAIMLANIYASETGRPVDLRSDHHGFEHLNTDLDAKFLPKRDMNDYRYRLVFNLMHTEPKLTHELRKVQASFNPIRRCFELQHRRPRSTH